jgi:hypothetical protein
MQVVELVLDRHKNAQWYFCLLGGRSYESYNLGSGSALSDMDEAEGLGIPWRVKQRFQRPLEGPLFPLHVLSQDGIVDK